MNRSAGFSLISMIVSLAVICALMIIFFKITGLDQGKEKEPVTYIGIAAETVKQVNSRAVETNQAFER